MILLSRRSQLAIAAVVDVGVGKHPGRDTARGKREMQIAFEGFLAAALE